MKRSISVKASFRLAILLAGGASRSNADAKSDSLKAICMNAGALIQDAGAYQ